MKSITTLTLGLALGGFLPLTAGAQETPNREPNVTDTEKAPAKAEMFIQKTGQAGDAEVQMATLAVQQGSSDKVKMLGAKLVKDHTQVNAELAAIAALKGVKIPAVEEKAAKKIAELQSMEGPRFDEAFLKAIAECHKKDIAHFEKARGEVKDPEVEAFIDKTLPVLKEHAKHIGAPVVKN